jgi:DNA replication and repair protein RecF
MSVDDLKIKYISSVCNTEDLDEMIKLFYDKLVNQFEHEKLYGMTLIGPHRDDFKFFMGDKEMSGYASQGQLRAAVLSLKLAEIDIFKINTGDFPILLLDDIFSELDIKKKNRLIKYMLDDVQTIITTTDLSMIDSYLIDRAKVFEISCGKVVNEVERKVIQNGE